MFKVNSGTMRVVIGVLTTCFLGYCVYFDYKRRNDVNYKKRVRERRLRNLKENQQSPIPEFRHPSEREYYFMKEIQTGEVHIFKGELEKGVNHLSKALAVCGRPTEFLELMQKSLPPEVFAMLILKMKKMSQFNKFEEVS